MTADLAYLVAVHDVAEVGLETRVATGHSCHDSSHTSSHHHMIFRFLLIAEQRRNRYCIHRQFLLEVPHHLHSFRVNNLGAIVCSSGQNSKITAENNGVDLTVLVKMDLLENSALEVIVNQPTIVSTHKESLIVDVPQSPSCNFVWFAACLVENHLEICQGWDLKGRVDPSDVEVEDCLEVEHFDVRRGIGFVLIMKKQETVGAQIKLDLFQFEGEPNVLHRFARLHIENLHVSITTSKDPSLPQATKY